MGEMRQVKGDPDVLSFEKGFLLQIYLSSIDKASHKRDLHWNADHDSSVSEPFPTTNCQVSYPRYQNRQKLVGQLHFETSEVESNLHKIIGQI